MWLVMAEDNDYILKVSNLGVKLQNQILLDHINFNVKKGTTLAILGTKRRRQNSTSHVLF